jgi:hypothetical protein
MSKVKVTVTARGVTLAGQEVPVGTEIEVSEKSAAALIAEGKAENGEAQGQKEDPNAGGGAGGSNEPTEEEKQAKALDAQYKRDELAAAAKAAGVDFAYDAKKDDIIAAVIAQGQAGALLK